MLVETKKIPLEGLKPDGFVEHPLNVTPVETKKIPLEGLKPCNPLAG